MYMFIRSNSKKLLIIEHIGKKKIINISKDTFPKSYGTIPYVICIYIPSLYHSLFLKPEKGHLSVFKVKRRKF